MGKLIKLKDFDSFILEEACTQRTSAISTAVSQIKAEFGDTKETFLKSAKEKGVDEIKDYIVKVLEPYVERDRRSCRRERRSYWIMTNF